MLHGTLILYMHYTHTHTQQTKCAQWSRSAVNVNHTRTDCSSVKALVDGTCQCTCLQGTYYNLPPPLIYPPQMPQEFIHDIT